MQIYDAIVNLHKTYLHGWVLSVYKCFGSDIPKACSYNRLSQNQYEECVTYVAPHTVIVG